MPYQIHEPLLLAVQACGLRNLKRNLRRAKPFNQTVHPGCYAGLRFAKNALNASFASSDLTRSANTWFSNFTA